MKDKEPIRRFNQLVRGEWNNNKRDFSIKLPIAEIISFTGINPRTLISVSMNNYKGFMTIQVYLDNEYGSKEIRPIKIIYYTGDTSIIPPEINRNRGVKHE